MRHSLAAAILAATCVPATACGPAVEDTVIDVVFDPCEEVVLVPAADASAAEIASIDDAISMWNRVVATRLTRDGAQPGPRLAIRFEEAAPMFHGIYEDEVGVVVVNRRLAHPRDRAITVAHELGHAFGLPHVPAAERESLMNPGNLDTEPNAGDASAVAALWGACPAGPGPWRELALD